MTLTRITNIGQLVSCRKLAGTPIRGAGSDKAIVEVLEDAAVLARDGIIVTVCAEKDLPDHEEPDVDIDADGGVVLPGLVDCHAHPVFAGDRADEFDLRNLGRPYEEIHAAGGGIRSTMAATRTAIAEEYLHEVTQYHLDGMLAAGTTTAEGKSGYALTLEGEVTSLRVLHAVAKDHPIDVVGTMLAAHTLPPEYDGRGDDYLDEVAIPAVQQAAEEQIARAADVFLERGSFTTEQARRYLEAAKAAGLDLRLHADQFTDQGGVDLAIELGARSIDHLEALEPDADRLERLGRSNTAAVLLPLSSLFLRRPYAPGRALKDAGAIVALASDFNPGSSYGESMFMAMSLACVGCGLTVEEALAAATVNSAWVLGKADRRGRIAPGFDADLVIVDQPSWQHIAYHVGVPNVQQVLVRGRVVFESGWANFDPADATELDPEYPDAMATKKPRKREYIPPAHEVVNKKEAAPVRSSGRPASGGRGGRGRGADFRPPEPSIRRTIRKLPIYFFILFALQYFITSSNPPKGTDGSQEIAIAAASVAAFVTVLFAPFMYYMERLSYRMQMKRIEQGKDTPGKG